MRGADIMVASVDAAGKSTVTDYHATKNGAPVKDGCQVRACKVYIIFSAAKYLH